MKNYIIQILIIISFCFSQTLEIYVFNQNNNVLENSNIIITNSKNVDKGGSTDVNGRYIFDTINQDNYIITVSHIGYENYKKELNVNKNKKYKLNVILNNKSILIPELKIIGDTNAPYQKLAGSATVIETRKLKQIDPIGTQEILEHIPGLSAFSDDGIGNSRISVAIRGLNPRRSSRVLILEDGIPIQPALYVYPNMYYNPPVERIDGIQVIKGSGSLKYGPQTMAGVINYYTSRPKKQFEGNATIKIGNNGYTSLFSELSGFGSEKVKHAIQLLGKKGDGFRDNNGFVQLNGTFKSNVNISENKNIYIKFSTNYENSNATYTGLTEYSFENDPNFNPKKDDNFKINRSSLDIIETKKHVNNVVETNKLYVSYFDRRWWRENDIFIKASDIDQISPSAESPTSIYDLIRIGNGKDNFGILRTFYTVGYEKLFSKNSYLFSFPTKYEYSARVYWERFIDNKKIGNSPNDRDGEFLYPSELCTIFNSNGDCDDNGFIDYNDNEILDEFPNTIPGAQSHHYETTAFSAYLSNSTNYDFITLNTGIRFEFFEQERIDLLDGSSYLDKTTIEFLPSFSFIKFFNKFNIFGGIHRGYTAPSSGTIKVTNFIPDNPSLAGGLELKSEKSWNKEIGIRSSDDKMLINYEFSLFHLDIEDMVAAGRGTVFENLGKVTNMGSETNLQINLQDFSFPDIFISHTYMKSKIVEANITEYFAGSKSIAGKSLPYVPRNILLLGLGKTIFNNITMRLDYKYVDKVYTDFHNLEEIGKLGIQGPVPSYSLINLSVNYNYSDKINISLVGKNLTDEIYIGSRLHSNPSRKEASASSGIIPGPRRQINFGIRYIF